jgi:hypothetical protein
MVDNMSFSNSPTFDGDSLLLEESSNTSQSIGMSLGDLKACWSELIDEEECNTQEKLHRQQQTTKVRQSQVQQRVLHWRKKARSRCMNGQDKFREPDSHCHVTV